MRKTFLTLALASIFAIGASAQSFNKTIVAPNGGVKAYEATNQYQHNTGLIKLDEPVTTLRYTVSTNFNDELSNGYPVFALAELSVLDADGKKISYTATSNADHNTIAGFDDGAGLPALNDGDISNYFHSAWYGDARPAENHYIELAFESAISEFSIEWVSRPNSPKNRPIVVGLTPAGTAFVPFQEWEFSVGDKVSKIADIDPDAFYTLYVEGPKSYQAQGDTTVYTGPGGVHIKLTNNSQSVGTDTIATPHDVMQLIPTGEEGVYAIANSLSGLLFANSGRWANYNGGNGWQYASDSYTLFQKINITERKDGEFELSYTIDEYYNVDGLLIEKPITFYIGYDMRGQLKIFEAAAKAELEQGIYGTEVSKFGLPVDFGFKLSKVNVADNVVIPSLKYNDITAEQREGELVNLKTIIKDAMSMYDEYIEIIDPSLFGYNEDVLLLESIENAAADTLETSEATVDVLKQHRKDINLNAAYFLAVRIDELSGDATGLQREDIFCSYPNLVSGKYPEESKAILEEIVTIANQKTADIFDYKIITLSAAKTAVNELQTLMDRFNASLINISEFPAMMDAAQGLPGTLSGGQYSWESPKLYLPAPVKGIRVTFLDSNVSDAYQEYKIIALSEIVVKDNDGNPITLTEASISSNSVESTEGSIAKLVDGDTSSSSYYHSTWWSGTFEPAGHVYLDIQFPQELDIFSINYVSRNSRCTPTEISVTNYKEAYDPLLFAPNPYNVGVKECTQITEVSQITDEGIYAIRGLLNTNPEIIADTVLAKEYWYTDATKYHTSVLNSEVPYFINKTDDGKYIIQSLYTGKYWPSMVADLDTATLAGELTGFVSSTPYKKNAAKLNIVPATSGIEGSFVLYEESNKVYAEVAEVDITGDTSYVNVNTPYAVYMDWYSGLAVRPVRDPQPWGGDNLPAELKDSWGDSLHFNKKNGEGQWKIYKISMDTPYTFWLGNLISIMDGAGYRQGEDPGCVNVASLAGALAEAQAVVADTVSAADVKETNAKAAALNLVASYDEIASAKRKPMVPGTYMIVSAWGEYYAKQGVEKAINVNEEGNIAWGSAPVVNEEGATDGAYCFEFIESPYREDYVMNGMFSEEDAAKIYIIKNVATGKYVGGADDLSTGFAAVADVNDAVGYMVSEAAGSSFSIRNIANGSWNMHTGGHNNGAGVSGSIVYWTSTDGASAWFLQSVTMDETSIGDLVVEGDEVVSVTYYTVGGAASSTPVKGVNIVKVVYANGAVETKKVIVE